MININKNDIFKIIFLKKITHYTMSMTKEPEISITICIR